MMISSLLDTARACITEADTPVAGPTPAAVAPPPLKLGDPAADADGETPTPKGPSSPAADAAGMLQAPTLTFSAEGITTPNTLVALTGKLHPLGLPPPMAARLTADQIARELVNDYHAATDSFTWSATPAGVDKMAERVAFLCEQVTAAWTARPLLRKATAPAYVIGDVHGNFSDLSFFLKQLLVLGDIALTPCDLVCLGDYVDRGPHSLECVVLLFALAAECPDKVVLLRGNHEDRIVCGDRAVYGDDSFLGQCVSRMGEQIGTKVFRQVTRCFRHLPLACELECPVSGAKMLCSHGGFPRFTDGKPRGERDKLALLLREDFPRFLTMFPNNPMAADDSGEDEELPEYVECAWFSAFDLIWSDPTNEEAAGLVDEHGFGGNGRGMNVVSFSSSAVEAFLEEYGYSMLFRAHQEKQFGLRISKSSRVVTLFTSSNYLGHGNGAGCAVLSPSGEVRLVMKSDDPPLPLAVPHAPTGPGMQPGVTPPDGAASAHNTSE